MSFFHTHFKPSILSNIMLCNSRNFTCKQNTWTNSSLVLNPNYLTVPGQYVGCPWIALSSIFGSTSLEPKSMATFGLTTPKAIFMAFYTRNLQVEENPYLSELSKIPKPVPTHSPCSVDQLLLLFRRESMV